jgi:hypothetical protein
MAEEVQNTETPQMPNITVKDLAVIVNIIDLSAQRGAWKGEELSTVGEIRNKIATVVRALTPQEAPAEEVANEVAEETPAPKKTRKSRKAPATAE